MTRPLQAAFFISESIRLQTDIKIKFWVEQGVRPCANGSAIDTGFSP
jgi:hypothetical protein